jgi:hypothetical protein
MAPEPVRPAPAPAAATFTPPEPKGKSLPSWLVSVLTVVAIGAGLALLYYLVSGRKSVDASKAPAAAVQPVDEPKTGAGSSDLTKNLEFTGLRVQEDKNQKVEVRMLAVNHSLGELPPMKLDVQLKTAGKPDVLAEFTADLPSMGPLDTREIKTTAKTKMRAYELPDWQFLRAEVAETTK